MLLRVLILTLLLTATAAAAAQSKTPKSTPSPQATNAVSTGTPSTQTGPAETTETDPVVAAVQQAMRMHQQAAAACSDAIEKSKHGGPLSEAQRFLLMAAALLYNSSNDLKRVGQKELTLAEKRTATGEQKERVAKSAETDAEKAEIARKAKASIAYGAAQGAIAESILEFSRRQEELAKGAAAASKGDSAALETSGKKIIEESAAAQSLYESVRETRAKISQISP